MRMSMTTLILLVLSATSLMLAAACGAPEGGGNAGPVPEGTPALDMSQLEYVRTQLAKYSRYDVAYDESLLDETQVAVIDHLVKAAGAMDELFKQQVYSRNAEIEKRLQATTDPAAEPLREFFRINYGPFDRLEHHRPFIGTDPKPRGANFYPEDMERAEFESWLEAHPEDREAFESPFTVIRRSDDGGLIAVPYSEHYATGLTKAAKHLRQAATMTENESLRTFLNSRADAFLSNDYYQSDMDWMDIRDNVIDVTIGPYEVYEDNLFNYKAAFEAFVCLRDPAESARLEDIKGLIPAMERNLPIKDEYKNFDRGTESPISVVDVVISAGDTRAGVQTIAFNLPNDERVREAKGCKKVLLKNIMKAKYERIYVPIAREVLLPGLAEQTDFEAFFDHTLMHEISHGLGPGNIDKNGRQTTVAKELKELYSAIEEAKADTLGVTNTQFLVDQGKAAPERAERAYITFLGGIFRSIRFGIGEAHGKGNMLILNYLLEQGGYYHDAESGRFGVDLDKIDDGFRSLATELLTLQAEGDYEGTAAFISTYGSMPPEVEAALARLDHIPVDIDPHFAVEF